ncbi:MAG: tRNA preQ1(34) S-adenosylmethionine ribosyltransferase-isomerase QueA [Chloroflexota bacterium]
MKTAAFDYPLPPERIAQRPLAERDASRLLVLHRETGELEHRRFKEIGEYLRPGDVLVANDSRVIPARLSGRKLGSGGRVEILLLKQLDAVRWQALVGGRRVKEGVQIVLLDAQEQETGLVATVAAVLNGAEREVTFNRPLDDELDQLGQAPLPPYIHERLADRDRYQTIYAWPPGSAAAPTAGLHFTPAVLLALREKGVLFETVTLHVGLDTFQPVSVAEAAEHPIHSEWVRLTPETARRINEAKLAGGRIIAVGTTSVRVLETAALRSVGVEGTLRWSSVEDGGRRTEDERLPIQNPKSKIQNPLACPWPPVMAYEGPTDLFILPGYHFRVVDALITNFHLPQSTLMMLVSAFAGRERIMAAYQAAIQAEYRFLSFGDAMLIL